MDRRTEGVHPAAVERSGFWHVVHLHRSFHRPVLRLHAGREGPGLRGREDPRRRPVAGHPATGHQVFHVR